MEEGKVSKFKIAAGVILVILANLIFVIPILYFSWSWFIEFVKDIWNIIF